MADERPNSELATLRPKKSRCSPGSAMPSSDEQKPCKRRRAVHKKLLRAKERKKQILFDTISSSQTTTAQAEVDSLSASRTCDFDVKSGPGNTATSNITLPDQPDPSSVKEFSSWQTSDTQVSPTVRTGNKQIQLSSTSSTPNNKIPRRFRQWYKEKVQPFWKITIAQIICVIYILVLTFSYPPIGIRDPGTNDIIDPGSAENTNNGVIYVNGSYRPVVAIGSWQKFCLAVSRMSAFSMYPPLVIIFITKMKALQSFLAKTPISIYVGMIKESHCYHAHAGHYIAFDVWVHTLFHLLRWGSQGNIELLWTSAAGISGTITVVATPLIAFPMMYYKNKLSYELRKGLHYLFYVFAVAMCFHVPPTAIPNGGFIGPILGSCICLYTLDAIYVYLFMAEEIETTAFHVLSSGVRISMRVSDRFRRQAGRGEYAYINLPWINDRQWHPFSLFEDPEDPSIMQMFLIKSGDWTRDVHKALSRDTTRPCWIKGPFPSPYSSATLYDNQVLVASGIGITPALAIISNYKSSRRVNLIWAVRDPEMLEFFLEHMYLDHDGWNLIFYTGKAPLSSKIEGSKTNIRVIRGRPQLGSIIPNVIYGIETGEGLPEKYTLRSKNETKQLLKEHVRDLDIDSDIGATEKVAKLNEYQEALGFALVDWTEEMQHHTMESFSNNGHQLSVPKDANFNLNELEESAGNTPTLIESGQAESAAQSSTAEFNADDLFKKLKRVITSETIPLDDSRSQASEENAKNSDLNNSDPKSPMTTAPFLDDPKSSLTQARDCIAAHPVDEECPHSLFGMRKGSHRSVEGSLRSPTGDDREIQEAPSGGGSQMWISVRNALDMRNPDELLTPAFCPWNEDLTKEMYVRGLDSSVMETWGIMYCGGSKPVIAALREISTDYGIDLHIDSFAW